MLILTHFLLRLSFGLAAGMALPSPRLVTSGYYRNHLYVTLGLTTLAAMILTSFSSLASTMAGLAAVFSYLGSVCWLYEKKRAGRASLALVAAASLAGVWFAPAINTSQEDLAALVASRTEVASIDIDPTKNATSPTPLNQQTDSINPNPTNPDAVNPDLKNQVAATSEAATAVLEKNKTARLASQNRESRPLLVFLSKAHLVTSGLSLGITMAAMLLGHWYLNAPGMQLAPLRQLTVAIALATFLHMLVCGLGIWFEWQNGFDLASLGTFARWFLMLRWGSGLLSIWILCWMTWKTLDVPNTQSATGILYVAVIGTFTGELAGLLLSTGSEYPL